MIKFDLKTQKQVFPINEYTQTTKPFRDRVNPGKLGTKKTGKFINTP